MDDQQVSVASLKTVLQCQAYILCYSKVRATSASVPTTPPSSSAIVPNTLSAGKGNSVANKDAQDSGPKNESNKIVAKSSPATTVKLQPELSIVRAIVASAPKTSLDVSDDSSSEKDDEKLLNTDIPSFTKKVNDKAKIASSFNSEDDDLEKTTLSRNHHSLRLVSRDGYIPANPMR